jgi:hypothetical protein
LLCDRQQNFEQDEASITLDDHKMASHLQNHYGTPSPEGQPSPRPKLEATASSWMENDLYPELYRPDGKLLAQ